MTFLNNKVLTITGSVLHGKPYGCIGVMGRLATFYFHDGRYRVGFYRSA